MLTAPTPSEFFASSKNLKNGYAQTDMLTAPTPYFCKLKKPQKI